MPHHFLADSRCIRCHSYIAFDNNFIQDLFPFSMTQLLFDGGVICVMRDRLHDGLYVGEHPTGSHVDAFSVYCTSCGNWLGWRIHDYRPIIHEGQFVLVVCGDGASIEIWACGKDGSMGVIHTRDEEHPILALFGMHDAYDKPILCCSCNDNSVILYELSSFTKRGTIFGKQEVGRIQSGPGGLFFTGDGTGQVAVWKWLTPRTA